MVQSYRSSIQVHPGACIYFGKGKARELAETLDQDHDHVCGAICPTFLVVSPQQSIASHQSQSAFARQIRDDCHSTHLHLINTIMAPKASGRTSARSGSSREQASSPPNQRRNRDTETPVGRRTRSARSQSVESQDQNAGVKKTRRGARSVSREGSVDSVGSNNSIASSRGGRTRQTTRVAAISRGKMLMHKGWEPTIDLFARSFNGCRRQRARGIRRGKIRYR